MATTGPSASDALASVVNAHYGDKGYRGRIEAALLAAGKNLATLTPDDTGAIDQLHGGQKAATLRLARLAGISPGNVIADLGGGIGGPARTLASEFGCTVQVVDLTEEFCEVGRWLTELTKLSDRVTFHHASALATPLPDGAFDTVWMQNSSMNIEDRPALYGEVFRLLKPGGTYALQEVMAGPGGPAFYPMNFARTASVSFVYSPEDVKRLAAAAGLIIRDWTDVTEEHLGDRRSRVAAAEAGIVRPTYLDQATAQEVNVNGVRNYQERRLLDTLAVFRKPL